MPVPPETAVRHRVDRCPGVTRPWTAEDGALVRIRLVGGRVDTAALAALVDLSAEHADGDLHLTSRANLQLRGIRYDDRRLPDGLAAGVAAARLLPSVSHELVRNIMVSPLSGRAGGRADLFPVAEELDRLLLADAGCASLAGRFLFVLDDGRGDLRERTADLAAVALDAGSAQVRAGTDQWGPVLPLDVVAGTLHLLARRFLARRGDDPSTAWHVDELTEPVLPPAPRDPRTHAQAGPPPYGRNRQDDGRRLEHVEVPDGVLTPALAADVLARAAGEVVVTPWRSLLLVDLEDR